MLHPKEINAFTANNEYTRHNRGRFTATTSNAIMEKTKHFLVSSIAFFKSTLNF